MFSDRKFRYKWTNSSEQGAEIEDNREISYNTVDGAAELLVDMLTCVSKDSELKIKAHSAYKMCEREGKFLHIWEIIHETHVQVRASLILFKNLYNIEQGSQRIEEYIGKFEQLCSEITNRGEVLTERQVVTIFLNGLSDFYRIAIENMEFSGQTPKTYSNAKERILAWKRLMDGRRPSENKVSKLRCFNCNGLGHKASQCKKPKVKTAAFCGAVILDTGANVSICNSRKEMTELVKHNQQVRGVNGDKIDIKEKGKFFNLNNVVHHPECPLQVLSMGHIIDEGHKVNYESGKDTFVVNINDDSYRFKRDNVSKLYTLCQNEEEKVDQAMVVQITEKIQQLHNVLGHPGDGTLKKMLPYLPDTEISSQDIERYRANKVPCPDCVIGKMVDKPAQSREQHPEAKIGEYLHADVMYIGMKAKKHIILVVVDHKTAHMNTVTLNDKSGRSIFVALEGVVEFYKSFGWKPMTIYFDQDSGIKGVEDRINNLGINLILRAPFRHERQVERYIRSLKDCVRTMFASLCREENEEKFDFLVPEAVGQATRLLNTRPNTRMEHSYPRLMVTKIPIKERELKFSFGERGYVKVSNPRSDIHGRAEPAIFIGAPVDTLGYRVYLVDKGIVVDRHDFVRTQEDIVLLSVTQSKQDALKLECDNMLRLGVYEFVEKSNVGSNCIDSFIFIKEKLNADGTFEKYKARLVARGDNQTIGKTRSLRSDTVDKKCLFSTLSVCSKRHWKLATMDVPTAFLHATIDEDIYMSLPKEVVEYYRSTGALSPKYAEKKVYVKLKKSLYGLRQAPKLWQEELTRTLEQSGLTKCISEPGVFYSNNIIALVHVDDILVIYEDNIDNLLELLRKYGKTKVSNGKVQQYLGMIIEQTDDGFEISQQGYVEKLIKDCKEECLKYPINDLKEKSRVVNKRNNKEKEKENEKEIIKKYFIIYILEI